ncbi:aminotransferase class III-fold pyridoxal phosphate-dependent enzyme [Vreelandella utahensis]|uniref:aminotransferase class III-fold pyridoxal phosphate-dependent enzyme n=1 Tax=Vreelandella halophila TaxID=86177 RepID=UPI000985DCDB|nr:aminotransferase class III-fold pyridoxal phosphate-dependent enzyme [Halomonas utahensis]
MPSVTALTTLALAAAVILWLGPRLYQRLQLSRAKHPSLQGHSRMARRVARLLPYYDYDDATFFRCDDAPERIAEQRRAGLYRLSENLHARSPQALQAGTELAEGLSDLDFTSRYRVPFQFRHLVSRLLPPAMMAEATEGPWVRDIDGNWLLDASGSYGVNVFGHDFYRACLAEGQERTRSLGLYLGAYHPVVLENVRALKRLSGLDEVSFHMSGTEAVMQAVRLARYHTGRSQLVRFCGAYHGWWDGVQPGIGSQRDASDVYTLRDRDERSLEVLRSRRDIACVLVSPFQALHPNAGAPGDAALIAGDRQCGFEPEAYRQWLHRLREVCSERGIVLILDEIFSGFRLAPGGAQEYFGLQADMVTYGKTLGGGLPVGVLCGRTPLMKRYRPDRPADICFARGTFNAHPSVMGCMNVFLERLRGPAIASFYRDLHSVWNQRAARLNEQLEAEGLPLRIANLVSIWSVIYTARSRYNWMFQFYLRDQGIQLPWTGTGRLIFSHDYDDEAFSTFMTRFVAAGRAMAADGWFWENPELGNAAIRKRVLGELIRQRLPFPRTRRHTAPAGGAAGDQPLQ